MAIYIVLLRISEELITCASADNDLPIRDSFAETVEHFLPGGWAGHSVWFGCLERYIVLFSGFEVTVREANAGLLERKRRELIVV